MVVCIFVTEHVSDGFLDKREIGWAYGHALMVYQRADGVMGKEGKLEVVGQSSCPWLGEKVDGGGQALRCFPWYNIEPRGCGTSHRCISGQWGYGVTGGYRRPSGSYLRLL